jgi:hypothetical protein
MARCPREELAIWGILEIVQTSLGRDAETGDEPAKIAGASVNTGPLATVRAMRWLSDNWKN